MYRLFLILILFSNIALANDVELSYTLNKDMPFWQKEKNVIKLGYDHLMEPLYIHTRITNTFNKERTFILEILNPKLDHIELKYNDTVFKTGDHQRYEKRPLKTNNFAFPIDIKSGETVDVYITISSNSAYYVPIKITDELGFLNNSSFSVAINLFCFGLMFSMIVYNAGVYFSSRNSLYLYYTLFLLSSFGMTLSLSGYGYKYIWSNHIIFNSASLLLFATASSTLLLIFSVMFLGLKKYKNGFYYKLILYTNIPILLSQLYIVIKKCIIDFNINPISTEIINIFYLFSVINILLPAFVAILLIKKIKIAKFYLFGMISMLIGFLAPYFIKVSKIESFNMDEPNIIFIIGVTILSFTFSALIGFRQKHEYLERQRMRQENEMLQRKNEEIKIMAETKTNFLANMSHEIRTPMNGVIGVSEMLKDTELNPRQKEYVDIIQNSADSLVSIINDILDITKFEAGKMDLEEIDIDVRELIHTCVSMLVASKGSKLKTYTYCYKDVPEIIQGDPTRIRQIITNFMGNAYKFTESGFVKCIVSANNGYLKFEIIDSGIGIPEEAQNKLFSKYSQAAKDTARKFGGTGLGLDISKKLSSAMGGEVGLISEIGKGSNFWFTIKYNTETAKPFKLLDEVICQYDDKDKEVIAMAENLSEKIIYDFNKSKHVKFYSQYDMMSKKELQELKQEELDFSHIKVLVAEDNPTNRLVINGVLKKMKIACDFAENGLEAVEKARENKYNIVFMDCEMPEMDGWEATEEIRNFDKKLMIIGLSAHALPEFEKKAIDSGMDGFMSKPINKQKMFDFFKENFK